MPALSPSPREPLDFVFTDDTMALCGPMCPHLPNVFGKRGTAMEENERGEEQRVRLRLSVKPELAEKWYEAADTLAVDRNQLATLVFSLGLRMLYVTVINPLNAQVSEAVEQRATEEAASIAADASLPLRRNK